jgi:hypothetical protein
LAGLVASVLLIVLGVVLLATDGWNTATEIAFILGPLGIISGIGLYWSLGRLRQPGSRPPFD